MNKRSILIVAVCICLALVTFFAALFVSECMDHECSDKNCEICLQIAYITDTVKQLKAAVFVACMFAAPLCAARMRMREDKAPTELETPISLKVQLNA